MRGIIIAGTHSGCGKTTVTLGIMAALRKEGLAVQPFKAGPDFIDAGLHRIAAGRLSRNLDLWMCGREYVEQCFRKHAATAGIAVIEGVMGLYDGDRSTASLASLLDIPVVLVVDAYGMAESAGAMVKGFSEYGMRNADCGPGFAGVVFNRVASENHYMRLKESVKDMPVLGYLPRELDFEIPHRHLGLRTAEEDPLGQAQIGTLADAVLLHIDMDAIIRNAELPESFNREDAKDAKEVKKCRVAVAFDKAFCFYYEDNLDLLRSAGAEIVRFSLLVDQTVPADVDAIYIGGGYPELYAAELSANRSMRESVRAWVDAGRPLYAECGGLMYLSQGIRDFDNRLFDMTGVFPFETRMMKKPRLGYREIVLNDDCILGGRGEKYRGHEFHYSEIAGAAAGSVYSVSDSRCRILPAEGFSRNNTLASYVHIHFGSNLRGADHFAEFIKGVRTA